jgi:hypothetical protein
LNTRDPENKLLVAKWNTERSLTEGRIVDQGRLAQDTGKHNWTGAISLDKRLRSGELDENEVEESVAYAAGCFVPTSFGAMIRCIDGRFLLGYDDDNPLMYGRPLGPQVPGGTLAGGIAWRLAQGNDALSFKEADLGLDIAEYATVDANTGFIAGGHTDEHAGPGKTGCGAIDGLEVVLSLFDYNHIEDLEQLTKMMLGQNFRSLNFDHTYTSSARLLAARGHYFAEMGQILNKLKEHNPAGATVQAGNHNEIIQIINLVPNTTFHGDHFNARTNGKIQAFNYDLWRTIDTADKLHTNPELQSRYLHSRAALAVGTLMHLTDGSQRFLIRLPTGISN